MVWAVLEGWKEEGGGDGSSLLGHCLVDKGNSLSPFLARLSRFSWKETEGEGGETGINLLCYLLRCYLDHFRAQISLQ